MSSGSTYDPRAFSSHNVMCVNEVFTADAHIPTNNTSDVAVYLAACGYGTYSSNQNFSCFKTNNF